MDARIATLIAVCGNDSAILFEKALRSIIEQKFTTPTSPRIYLAIDGPINSDIEQIVSRYAESLHLIFRTEKNRGLAMALNSLILHLGDEEFIFRMDSDDESLPERYQKQLDKLLANKEIDILGTSIIEIEQGRGGTRQRVVTFCRGPEDAVQRLCWRVPVAHPTVCFRRSVLRKIDAYPDLPANQDIALWFKCAKLGLKFDSLAEPLLKFNVNEDFWRRRGFKRAANEFQIYFSGVWSLYGFSWRLIPPIFRLALRLMPTWVMRKAYDLRLLRR